MLVTVTQVPELEIAHCPAALDRHLIEPISAMPLTLRHLEFAVQAQATIVCSLSQAKHRPCNRHIGLVYHRVAIRMITIFHTGSTTILFCNIAAAAIK